MSQEIAEIEMEFDGQDQEVPAPIMTDTPLTVADMFT